MCYIFRALASSLLKTNNIVYLSFDQYNAMVLHTPLCTSDTLFDAYNMVPVLVYRVSVLKIH